MRFCIAIELLPLVAACDDRSRQIALDAEAAGFATGQFRLLTDAMTAMSGDQGAAAVEHMIAGDTNLVTTFSAWTLHGAPPTYPGGSTSAVCNPGGCTVSFVEAQMPYWSPGSLGASVTRNGESDDITIHWDSGGYKGGARASIIGSLTATSTKIDGSLDVRFGNWGAAAVASSSDVMVTYEALGFDGGPCATSGSMHVISTDTLDGVESAPRQGSLDASAICISVP